MIYIDTNVFVYAIENHRKYGKSCKEILKDVEDGKLGASCSVLVLVELINVLKKINDYLSNEGKPKLNTERNIEAVMSLPLVWIDMDFLVIEKASSYSFDVNGVDYVHIASMELNSISEVFSADKDFDKVGILKRIDPLNYRRVRA